MNVDKSMFMILIMLAACSPESKKMNSPDQIIALEHDQSGKQISILVDGKLFTKYHYSDTLNKPFLYPVYSSIGTVLTRGFPIDPRPYERVDHPHHTGIWFNHGNVNGIDFWNSSNAISDEKKPLFGNIVHREILRIENGGDFGILEVKSDWINHENEVLLNEHTIYHFYATENQWTIERRTKLTALREVKFKDSKEGMFAIRVSRAFEAPSQDSVWLTGADGLPPYRRYINNEGINGYYKSSNGIEGEAVWGTQNDWVALSAVVENDSVTIAIFDHPDNPGYPAHWHARDYGLFSINNLGRQEYNKTLEPLEFELLQGESMEFNHQMAFKSGGFLSFDELSGQFNAFAKQENN